MKRLRSPIVWFGGKGRMIGNLLPLLPPHDYYVEPFGGGASILLAKPSCRIETYNDIDEGLVNFFRVLADPKLFEAFVRRVTMLPVSRKLYKDYCASWRIKRSKVERAVRWFVVARQSFAGRMGSGGWGSNLRGPSAKVVHAWLTTLEYLPEVHARLQGVQIECADWRRILDRYQGEGYLAYCDPPFVLETRGVNRYAHELSLADHKELIKTLLYYEGAVVLSGYKHAVHIPLQRKGWKRWDFSVYVHAKRVSGRGSRPHRVESVWLNPEAIRRHTWEEG